jgi:hypothetical protein
MCLEIQKDRMTLKEVLRARGEFVVPEDHRIELEEVISSKFKGEVYQKEATEFITDEMRRNIEKYFRWG